MSDTRISRRGAFASILGGWATLWLGPRASVATLAVCAQSSLSIAPDSVTRYTYDEQGRLLSVVKLVRQRLNPTLDLEGVLLTMHDGRTLLTRRVEEEARRYFGPTVYQTVIPRNIKLGEAPSHGQPIIHYDIGSSGADAYLRLTQEVLAHGTRSSR